ncbi:MAG TPA: DUF1326 domain-containing protein [Anaerolineales bacterium]|nr:DUF1326 domain-containing protein [Anaerolineales bacterium]
MGWNLSGKMVESCTCNLLCPCWFGVKELMNFDKDYCGGTILFRVDRGDSNGTNLTGLDVVLAVDFPGPTLFDGNGTARLLIDERADSNQQKAIEEIMQGKKGGPMTIVSQLANKWLPTQKTKIEVKDDGKTLTATMGKFGQIKSQELRNESGRPMVLQGSGFASAFQMENDSFIVAPSGTEWSDPEMPHSQFTTKSGAAAKFSWKGN